MGATILSDYALANRTYKTGDIPVSLYDQMIFQPWIAVFAAMTDWQKLYLTITV